MCGLGQKPSESGVQACLGRHAAGALSYLCPHSCHPVLWRGKRQDEGVWDEASLGSTETLPAPPVLGALLSGLSHSELLLRPSGTRPPTFPLHQTTGQSCAQGRPHKAGTLTRSAFYNAGWDWADLTEDPTPHQGWACCWSGELGLTCQVGCVACAWPLREPPPSTVREAVRDNTGTETPQGRA